MAWPPEELLTSSLSYAAKLLACAAWRPVSPEDRAPVNWQTQRTLLRKAGLKRTRGLEAYEELVSSGWASRVKLANPETGAMRKALRLHLSAERTPVSGPPNVRPADNQGPPGRQPKSARPTTKVRPSDHVGDGGESRGINSAAAPLPPTIVIREPRAEAQAAAEGLFHELDIARRELASELPPEQWARIRSSRLNAYAAAAHDNLAFAVEVEGLELVTAVVCWGWREAAALRRPLHFQANTFSKSGQAWAKLLEAYRAAHDRDVKPDILVDGQPLDAEEQAIWEEWGRVNPSIARERILDHRADKRRAG